MHPPPPKSIPGVGCAPRKQTCDSPQYGSYSTCSERPSPRVCPRRRFCVAWTCFTYRLAGQHMDFYFLVHVLWLVNLLSVRRRKAIAEVWPCYCGALVSLVIFQHLLHLRLPPALCRDYPRRTTSTEIHSNLIKWLYLPDLAKKPDADLLLFDFLLLLVASLQWQLSVDENTAPVRIKARDNVEVSRDLRPDDLAQLSPVPNFIFCQ
ncbi:piezo-type mechanosensitive ion channel component 2-like isoform X2 [Camelus ferus]|uniref:Piezo-type mechanosensitive ion channel component 2-like isoform X2 n=1 Tax=Camelus ferus TaxID=419612 RepID=A0A8B8RH97_CAMFR|nr:piezo-type mechanosensitive ion channel component 2-like isoform X2 [Camelus ferus]